MYIILEDRRVGDVSVSNTVSDTDTQPQGRVRASERMHETCKHTHLKLPQRQLEEPPPTILSSQQVYPSNFSLGTMLRQWYHQASSHHTAGKQPPRIQDSPPRIQQFQPSDDPTRSPTA